jgi:hypothetical protein
MYGCLSGVSRTGIPASFGTPHLMIGTRISVFSRLPATVFFPADEIHGKQIRSNFPGDVSCLLRPFKQRP